MIVRRRKAGIEQAYALYRAALTADLDIVTDLERMRSQERYAGKEVRQKPLECKRQRNARDRQHRNEARHRNAERAGNDDNGDRPQHGLYRTAEKRFEACVDVTARIKYLFKRPAQYLYCDIAYDVYNKR